MNVPDFAPLGEIDPMRNRFILFVSMALLAAGAANASAQKLAVFADKSFRPALEEIAPIFAERTGFEVQLSLGSSDALAERIIRAEVPPDVFFPASETAMQLVMEKGLVDVALKRNVLLMPAAEPTEEGVEPEPQYTSAAVLANAANRLQAMAYVEFLTSDEARAAFARQGFALP